MDIHHFTVGPFLEHTYILSDPKTKEALVIDPGGENEKILKYLKEKDLHLIGIFSTHGHIDHIAGAYELREMTKASYRLNERDHYWLDNLSQMSIYFGMPPVLRPVVDASVEEGQELTLGNTKISVIATPGHIFVGDTLFDGSIGRTDLPGGNHKELIHSIKTKLLTLDDKLIVHCGHGPETTIQKERSTNPFLVSVSY
ncbi:MAG: MBL fold metallo-hydrolase [Deltaproteobacteria bacterium]|nr:MBL fold metallo-hydrolase [Deltaproteobacteria bacterium]